MTIQLNFETEFDRFWQTLAGFELAPELRILARIAFVSGMVSANQAIYALHAKHRAD